MYVDLGTLLGGTMIWELHPSGELLLCMFGAEAGVWEGVVWAEDIWTLPIPVIQCQSHSYLLYTVLFDCVDSKNESICSTSTSNTLDRGWITD